MWGEVTWKGRLGIYIISSYHGLMLIMDSLLIAAYNYYGQVKSEAWCGERRSLASLHSSSSSSPSSSFSSYPPLSISRLSCFIHEVTDGNTTQSIGSFAFWFLICSGNTNSRPFRRIQKLLHAAQSALFFPSPVRDKHLASYGNSRCCWPDVSPSTTLYSLTRAPQRSMSPLERPCLCSTQLHHRAPYRPHLLFAALLPYTWPDIDLRSTNLQLKRSILGVQRQPDRRREPGRTPSFPDSAKAIWKS
jgi:hypothetical protein